MRSTTNALEQVLRDIYFYTEHEDDLIAVLANVAAALKAQRPRYTWVGFYLFREERQEFILGPFQGPATCTTRIPLSAGMCGLAARECRTIVLPDVHTDTRYISCSPTVRSEIVVPLVKGTQVLGVLDVDSDEVDAFDTADRELLEAVAGYLVQKYQPHNAGIS